MRSSLLLLVAGILAIGCDSPTESQTAPTNRLEAPGTPPEPHATAQAPEVSNDPLGLLDRGWQRSRRDTFDRYQIIDAYLCTEHIDWQAKGFMPIVSEGYQAPGESDAWVDVTYVDYGDAATATSRLTGLADPVMACENDPIVRAKVETIKPDTAPGFQAYGYVDNDSRSWVVTNSDGLAVLFNGAYIPAAMERSLTEQAIEFLQ